MYCFAHFQSPRLVNSLTSPVKLSAAAVTAIIVKAQEIEQERRSELERITAERESDFPDNPHKTYAELTPERQAEVDAYAAALETVAVFERTYSIERVPGTPCTAQTTANNIMIAYHETQERRDRKRDAEYIARCEADRKARARFDALGAFARNLRGQQIAAIKAAMPANLAGEMENI
jgi:hypothetical protein